MGQHNSKHSSSVQRTRVEPRPPSEPPPPPPPPKVPQTIITPDDDPVSLAKEWDKRISWNSIASSSSRPSSSSLGLFSIASTSSSTPSCYHETCFLDLAPDLPLRQWTLRAGLTDDFLLTAPVADAEHTLLRNTDDDAAATFCLLGVWYDRYKRDPQKALACYEKAAASIPEAQYFVACHCYQAQHHLERARRYFAQAAVQGHLGAQVALGCILLDRRPPEEDEALRWLTAAAEKNHAQALFRLGAYYEEKGQPERSIPYYEQAATAADSTTRSMALYLIGMHYFRTGSSLTKAKKYLHSAVSANNNNAAALRALGLLYLEHQPTRAHQLFLQAAQQGDVHAMNLVAQLKMQANDEAAALTWYERAASHRSVTAQLALGRIFHKSGQPAKALPWFEQAAVSAAQGEEEEDGRWRNAARFMVAQYRLCGAQGIARDPAWAVQELLYLANTEAMPEACYYVGACYEEGVQFLKDLGKAFEYYEKAAQLGYPDAQFQVALMLSNGGAGSTSKDRVKAFAWYQKAADQGHRVAQYSLGLYYRHGIAPVQTKDLTRASRLFRASALQDYTPAMVDYATLLDQQKKKEEAVSWLRRAASMGEPAGMRELAATAYEGSQTAYDLLKTAAFEKHDPLSWCALARYHEHGWTVPASLAEAIRCLEKAISLGHLKAGLLIGEMYERKAMWQEALDQYTRLAEQHPMLSQVGWLARLAKARLVVFKHKGSAQDQRQVHDWLRDMVEQDAAAGHHTLIEAFEMLGVCCEHGYGTTKDTSTAITCYEAVVNMSAAPPTRVRFRLAILYLEDPKSDAALAYRHFESLVPSLDAMNHASPESRTQARHVRYQLGRMLLHGTGTTQDTVRGQQWLREAADEGDGAAAYELGRFSALNHDEHEARRRFEQGVSAGHPGCMREFALILERDEKPRECGDWLERAAQLGDVDALVHLAGIYDRRGQMDEAIPLYLEAAQQHAHPGAMVKLAERYSVMGRHVEAVSWLRKAQGESLAARVMLASYRLQGRGGIKQDDWEGYKQLVELTTSTTTQDDDGKKQALGLAYYLLGQCSELGRGTLKDLDLAESRYLKAVEIANHVEAMYRLGLLYRTQQQRQKEDQALEWFRRAAQVGRHPEAQYQIGLCHRYGYAGLEVNIVAARKYFTKASDQGHPRAKYELAQILWTHQREYHAAYALYRAAARLKVPEALCELGHLHHQGFKSMIQRDHQRAFQYYCDAAELGDGLAALMVGTYFEQQSPVDRKRALQWYETAHRLGGCGHLAELAIGKLKHTMADDLETHAWEEAEDLRQEAYTWFVRAAAGGIEHAKVMVGLYHLNGWGRLERDPARGFELLRQVAEAGGSEAFAQVAKCYEQGVGTAQNMEQALVFWKMAAEMGDVDALVRVGEFYEKGLVTGQVNLEEAARYYARAKNARLQLQQTDSEHTLSSSSSSSYSLSTQSSFLSRR